MSALLTRAVCERAWKVVSLAADGAHEEDGITNQNAGTIVVLDPTVAYAPGVKISSAAVFMDHIDVHHQDWAMYCDYAQAMAMLSWRTGLSSRDVQQTAPHLFKEPTNGELGDIKLGGSVVRDGLVVAFCGVQPEFAEWIADTMAGLLIAMCRREMTMPGGIMESGNSFVAGLPQRIPSILR